MAGEHIILLNSWLHSWGSHLLVFFLCLCCLLISSLLCPSWLSIMSQGSFWLSSCPLVRFDLPHQHLISWWLFCIPVRLLQHLNFPLHLQLQTLLQLVTIHLRHYVIRSIPIIFIFNIWSIQNENSIWWVCYWISFINIRLIFSTNVCRLNIRTCRLYWWGGGSRSTEGGTCTCCGGG